MFSQPLPTLGRLEQFVAAVSFAGWAFIGTLLIVLSAGFLVSPGSPAPSIAVALSIATLAWAVILYTCLRSQWALLALSAGTLIAMGIAAFAAALSAYEFFWDGMTYHQLGILELAKGWNPVGSAELSTYPEDMWVNFYPKASWLVGNVVLQLTHELEAGKALNGFLLLLTFFSVLHALLALEFSATKACIGALLATTNPVALSQLMTFYVDGLLAMGLTSLIAFMVSASRGRHLAWLGVMSSGIFVTNLKFTGLIYVTVALATFTTYVWFTERARFRAVLASAATLILAVGIVGFNPYITNAQRHGHSFYPLKGEGAVDVIRNQTVPHFLEYNAASRFALSFFSRTSADSEGIGPQFKWPWQVRYRELAAMRSPDTRYGGMGPLFAITTLVAVGIGLVMFWQDRQWRTAMFALTLGVMVSVAINPAAWWARLVPQQWLVPCTLAFWGLLATSRPLRVLSALCVTTLFVNSALAGWVHCSEAIEKSAQLSAQLKVLRASEGTALFFRLGQLGRAPIEWRLEHAGIRYRDEPGCKVERELELFPPIGVCAR
ncbi:MAG: hypothetical protein K1X64_17005 [Myxococcaceae bacterium]|nr:hypothetical protein [Myxococcaceae bacterium]